MEELDNTIETTKDKGNALEKNVEFIFQSAGFSTQRNVKIAKYEIDVLAEIGVRNIVIECKNFQNSNLVIRNLIHQWNSKNELIKANKLILVLAGVKIKTSDIELANKFDIELWDENTLTEFFNLSLKPRKLKEKLLEKIDFKPISISEIYRDFIANLIIKPLLTGTNNSEDEEYELFNNWLRKFIRTDLQLNNTTKLERTQHISLFEGSKEKGAFFNLFKVKRNEKEYWDTLIDKLTNESYILDGRQEKYLKIMNELMEEYNSQHEYYNSGEFEEKTKTLIRDRIYYSLITNVNKCNFGFKTHENVLVFPENNGKFLICIENINEKQANLVNWILTSEYDVKYLTENNVSKDIYSWNCQSLEEVTEKTFRILEEFYGLDEDDELRDYNM